MKKTFFYNFVPSKAEEEEEEEEEACKDSNTTASASSASRNTAHGLRPGHRGLQNPWPIKKAITLYEAFVGKLVLPFADIFEHVFRYWTFDMTKFVTLGHKKNVKLWDVTKENNTEDYECYIEMLPNEDCALVCFDLFKDRGLGVDDEIALYWDPRSSNLNSS